MTFIVLEGPDGSAKTTLAKALATTLRADGREVMLTSEPWDRAVIDHARGLTPRAAHMQFIADRARHIERVILPALAQGVTVVCDRYALTGVVYALAQEPGLGVRTAWLREGVDPGDDGALTVIPRPDLVLVCDAPDEVLDERLSKNTMNYIDADRDLQRSVRGFYRDADRFQPITWRVRHVSTLFVREASLFAAMYWVREVL